MPETIIKSRPFAIRGRSTRAQTAGVIILVGLSLDASSVRSAETANQPVDRFHITAEEQAACGADAMELCSATYPDEEKLLACRMSARVRGGDQTASPLIQDILRLAVPGLLEQPCRE